MNKKVWLVTGCSTGFGNELVKLLAKAGEQVIGTVRNESQIGDLEAYAPTVKGILLDVVNQDQIDQARNFIEKEYGRLDVLVNNAGYGSIGPVEEVSEEEMKRQFDVNVFGSVRMMKLALPFMRKQRSGHIINVTSIAGLNGFPGIGIYNGSKFALEGIGESLFWDVKHMGIKVTNVEPGPFRTDWAGRSASFAEPEIDDYKETAHKNMNSISEVSGKQVGDPVRGAQAMIDLVALPDPPVHLVLGGPAYGTIRKKLDKFKEELDNFEFLGRPTDYTEEELKEMGD